MHLAWAQQVLFGEVPGRDFVDPGMPLMYTLSAAVQWLSPGPFSEAVICCALLGLAAAVTCVVSHRSHRIDRPRRHRGVARNGVLSAAVFVPEDPRARRRAASHSAIRASSEPPWNGRSRHLDGHRGVAAARPRRDAAAGTGVALAWIHRGSVETGAPSADRVCSRSRNRDDSDILPSFSGPKGCRSTFTRRSSSPRAKPTSDSSRRHHLPS